MTPEELAAIKKRLADAKGMLETGLILDINPWFYLKEYADDVERLTAENAALRKIAQEVASNWVSDNYGDCAWCGAVQDTMHTPDCLKTKAQALVGE